MVRLLFVSLAGSLLISCTADINIEDTSDPSAGHDFLNSYVTVSAPAPADGTSVVNITVYLINSDNSRVAGYTPDYNVTVGTGVIKAACSKSTGTGISFCQVRATEPGTKTLSYTNVKISLTANPVFTYGRKTETSHQIVSSGSQGDSTLGYKMFQTIGNYYNGVRDKSMAHTIYSGIQGKIESDQEP